MKRKGGLKEERKCEGEENENDENREWCIFKTIVHSFLLPTTSDIGECTSKYYTAAFSAYKL